MTHRDIPQDMFLNLDLCQIKQRSWKRGYQLTIGDLCEYISDRNVLFLLCLDIPYIYTVSIQYCPSYKTTASKGHSSYQVRINR